MQIHPYLIFNGNCATAMQFYQHALKGELEINRYSDMTELAADVPPEYVNRVMHAKLQCNSCLLMASDSLPEHPSDGMSGFSVAVMCDNPTEGERIFDALSYEGNITVPWEPTPWAKGFGMLTDKFGVTWMVNGGLMQAGA